jgi:hypothetical protein
MEATDLPELPLGLNRSPQEWAKVNPDAVVAGSTAQARNVIEMMQQDIARLAVGFAPAEDVTRRGTAASAAAACKIAQPSEHGTN